MALMSESVEVETSSFEEAVQKPVWVDAKAEKYDSIIRNSLGSGPKTNKQVSGEFHMVLQGEARKK